MISSRKGCQVAKSGVPASGSRIQSGEADERRRGIARRVEPAVARGRALGGGIEFGVADAEPLHRRRRDARRRGRGCCATPTATAAPSRSTGPHRRHRHRCWSRRPGRKTRAGSGGGSRRRRRSSSRRPTSPTCRPVRSSRAAPRSSRACRSRPPRRRHRPGPRPRSRGGRGSPGRPRHSRAPTIARQPRRIEPRIGSAGFGSQAWRTSNLSRASAAAMP